MGVKPYVLRYWETEFPEIAPSKSKSKQRLYKRREVETILRIRDLLYGEKFTIEGARQRLKEGSRKGKGKAASKEKQIRLPLPAKGNSKELLRDLKKQLGELQKLIN